MTSEERRELIDAVDADSGRRREILRRLGIPASTFYAWRRRYVEGGVSALGRTRGPRRTWNRITEPEETRIVEVALAHPESSPRLIATKITDEEAFAASESTIYRVLKARGLVAPRPLPEMPASKEYKHKTTRANEMWQIDATTFFVVGWGYYKLIPVLDDFSRKILAWKLFPDETAFSISVAVEAAIEEVGLAAMPKDQRPKLLSDNGAGFVAKLLAGYLEAHGIEHIFGKPYHPQTQGKIERFNRRIKEGVCLLVYTDPTALERSIREAIERYNVTPHEALSNVSPNDVYAGRREEILAKRAAKKIWTMQYRRAINMGLKVETA